MTPAAKTSLAAKASPAAKASRSAAPTLETEREFLSRGIRYLAALDEVGRGALAGPVSVGLVILDLQALTDMPEVRDSKLLTPARREELEPRVREWAVACGVGHAEAYEIDAIGITDALALAAERAYSQAMDTWDVVGVAARPEAVLLDGKHNWLTREPSLLDGLFAADGAAADVVPGEKLADLPVTMKIKGDMTCQSIAAASILAKVERDGIMAALDVAEPAFGWGVNKGYGTQGHRDAIVALGPSDQHRKSWKLV